MDDIEAKRNASGMSPEELAIRDAYAEGARVGSRGGAAGLNPHTDISSPEAKAWERGRSAADAARFYRNLSRSVA